MSKRRHTIAIRSRVDFHPWIGNHAKADVTITMADADMVSMAEGKLDGMQAFMGGKLKIKGNMMLAQKLGGILAAAK
jgi:putative sterol carrier protein